MWTEIHPRTAVVLNDCQSVIDAMAELINSRRFGEAQLLGEQHKERHGQDHEECDNVHFWFQLSLACRLCGDTTLASHYETRARQCPGFNPLIEGDFLRDRCLSNIRTRNLTTAAAILKKARILHADDANRMAALVMVEARLEFAVGGYIKAAQLHLQANQMWHDLGDKADRQWIKNNRFHWLKATVMDGEGHMAMYLYGVILESEPSWQRKLAAWLMLRLGPRGVKLAEKNRLGLTRTTRPCAVLPSLKGR